MVDVKKLNNTIDSLEEEVNNIKNISNIVNGLERDRKSVV